MSIEGHKKNNIEKADSMPSTSNEKEKQTATPSQGETKQPEKANEHTKPVSPSSPVQKQEDRQEKESITAKKEESTQGSDTLKGQKTGSSDTEKAVSSEKKEQPAPQAGRTAAPIPRRPGGPIASSREEQKGKSVSEADRSTPKTPSSPGIASSSDEATVRITPQQAEKKSVASAIPKRPVQNTPSSPGLTAEEQKPAPKAENAQKSGQQNAGRPAIPRRPAQTPSSPGLASGSSKQPEKQAPHTEKGGEEKSKQQADIAEQKTTAIPKAAAPQKSGKADIAEQDTVSITKISSEEKPGKLADISEQKTAAIERSSLPKNADALAAQNTVLLEHQPVPQPSSKVPGHTLPTTPPPGQDNGTDLSLQQGMPPVRSDDVFESAEDFAERRARVNRVMIVKKRRKERKEGKRFPLLARIAVIILLILIVLTSGGGGAAFAYYQAQLPQLQGIADHSLFQTTHIYDRNGKPLYDLYDKQIGKGRRTYVDYKNISPLLVEATVAVEDKSFWENPGFDFQGIGRAITSGGSAGGGSTITQQLIKVQLFEGLPRTPERKIQEIFLAAGLNQQYPKWKIMEMYLNTVNYGNINYGVEAAAQDYFGLKPKCDKKTNTCIPAVAQLTLGQATLLAGLPNSPTTLNPIYNKENALKRQQQVLASLLRDKKITEQQAKQAADEMKKFKFVSHSSQQKMQAPHFVNFVIDQLAQVLGPENLRNGGYSIYTSLDLDLEKKVEQITYSNLYEETYDKLNGVYTVLSRDRNVNNAAVMVMNPRTGEILAMNGSVNYNSSTPEAQGQVNAVTQTFRQPGSSFKPIVYATAFEMGWYPGMILPDRETLYPYPDGNGVNGWYTPQNYDRQFRTNIPMTARKALGNSFNISAVDTVMFAGIPNVLNMAGRLGIDTVAKVDPKNTGASLALGAKEASLYEMTGAYAVFANKGKRVPPVSILKIVDNQGRTIYQYDPKKPQGQQVVKPEVAFMISDMLSDKEARYLEFPPGNDLELPDGRPAAVKTGTTDSFKDNWTIGYTPYLTVGVWAGNSDNSEMHDVIGLTGAGPIWNQVMDYASKKYNFPMDGFTPPGNVHKVPVSNYTGLLPGAGDPVNEDWMIDSLQPTIYGSNYYVPTATCVNGKDQNGKPCTPPKKDDKKP
ncbi:membrane peptidoglycan carboxypeptidase [Thermosporothrix hazakensis]|jgi:membrane peptidoglycan carboxypeptidase|uniref:Membrane peptidoglycan carboxypeptidase n=2 Tax=Thermosporothrix hazakensis TaxID=644383 RepID=A0A326TYN1_THEHA|nr:membrane peptidoglycan carboxypeptidase [Thermosporothrix hazakensis]